MSKRMYDADYRLRSISDFDHCESKWYRVRFGNTWKTMHRSMLESLQYHTLVTLIIHGSVWAAKRISES